MRLIYKLWLSFAVTLFGICFLSYLTISSSREVIEQSKKATDINLKLGVLALEANLDIVQIQQWLTDISATRGLPGFDDGYAEAEVSKELSVLIENFKV